MKTKEFRAVNFITDEKEVVKISNEEINDEMNLNFFNDDRIPEVIAMVKILGGDNIVEFLLDNDSMGLSDDSIEGALNEFKMYVASDNDEYFDENSWDGTLDPEWSSDFKETVVYEDILNMFEDEWEFE